MFHGHLNIDTHIFLTGATGYIGGSVLTRLLSHPLSDTFQTTVLVRDPSKAKQFRTMGIKAVVGSTEDATLLKQLASEADYVFACADGDDLNAAKAILAGLKERYDKTGHASTLLHASNAATVIDDEQGMDSTDIVYSDMNIPQLETLHIAQPHRIVDVALVEADAQGYVESYIILPGTIYGTASGPLVDLGLQNAHSQQIPKLVEAALDRGQGGMIGEGRNVWPNVHIDDVADLFIMLFDLIVDGNKEARRPKPDHGRTGFYFCENGEHTWLSVAGAIAKAMYDKGNSGSPQPTSFTEDEMQRYFPEGTMLGTNSRCKAERARMLGWRPMRNTGDMLDCIRNEVDRLS
ncbi:hypothetical protein AX17_007368 [Amanita inopinata Kibby_2008]|nr:hypothetical protein AX17_007368 [Amanita inopinata Kibby_2008]